MISSKIASVVLWVVIAITIITMLIFFAGSNFVNQADFQSKVNKIENPEGGAPGQAIARDLQSADSLGVSSQAVTPVKERVEAVQLTFLEKLVYYKTDVPLIWGYVLLIATILIAISFPAVYIFMHPKNLLRTLLGLVGAAVIIGLAFMVSSGAPMEITGYTGTANSDPMTLKLIDAGLITTYLVFGLTLLSIVVSEIVLYFR